MGLISKDVEQSLNPSTINRYSKLGYIIPKTSFKNGKYGVKKGTTIFIKVEDLSDSSHTTVLVKCDVCGLEKHIKYVNFLKQKKSNEEYHCKKCSYLYVESIEKKISTRISNKGTFEDWCELNNKQELLEMWDYSLNKKAPNEVCISSRTKYWFKCKNKKHNSFQRVLYTITSHVHNVCCNECRSFDSWVSDSLDDDFYQKYWHSSNSINPRTIGSTSEKTAKFICQNNNEHIYDLRIVSFKLGVRCNLCPPIVKGEKEIHSILSAWNIPFEQQKSFDGLVGLGGRKLTYDFYIPDKNILIEYHGEQHSKPIDYFGGQLSFEKQIKHDMLKTEYAHNNNIRLLVVWHYEFDKLQEILKREV